MITQALAICLATTTAKLPEVPAPLSNVSDINAITGILQEESFSLNKAQERALQHALTNNFRVAVVAVVDSKKLSPNSSKILNLIIESGQLNLFEKPENSEPITITVGEGQNQESIVIYPGMELSFDDPGPVVNVISRTGRPKDSVSHQIRTDNAPDLRPVATTISKDLGKRLGAKAKEIDPAAK